VVGIKRIWLINHYATRMYKDKGGRHFSFAKYLKLYGYEPHIICANTYHDSNKKVPCSTRKSVFYDRCIVDDIPFVFLKTTSAIGNGIKRIFNMLFFFINLLASSKFISSQYGKPDIILASSVHPLTMVAGILICKRMKIPCICEIRDLWPEAIFTKHKYLEKSMLGKIMQRGEYWIYKKADALIFTMEGGRDYIQKMKWDIKSGGDVDMQKAFYINNGVDLDEFEKDSLAAINSQTIFVDQSDDSKIFLVVYVGAIRSLNNIEILVETAFYLKDYHDIKIYVYGEGNKKETFIADVQRRNLKNISFMNNIDRRDIPNMLKKSSLNILSYNQSQWNWSRGSSSNKLFEYMASGKPIISTCQMGYSIIDKYSCGVEIENATAQQLGNEILRFKNMSKEEYDMYCQNARKGVKDFDFKELTKKLINIMESLG